jgi:hypothetical protein
MGKPTVSPQLMLALINRTGQLDDIQITDDGQACTVTMRRRNRKPHTETFSMKDAALMKTTEYVDGNKKTISLSEKYNWKQQPAVMRKWRAVAACARVVFPDVILGMYTPEEMGATVDVEGDVVEYPADPAPEPTIEAEPEPTEAPALALADEAPDNPQAELRWLAWKLDYTDDQLLKWLRKRYNVDEGLNINQALLSLGDGELQQAIAVFKQHVEAKEAA